jgi:predicted metal-dependent hydrolase
VAHDVYQAVSPGYWRRAFGVLHGSLDVIRWSRRCYRALLMADGDWTTFVTSPISAGLLLVSALMVAAITLPAISKKREEAFQEEAT